MISSAASGLFLIDYMFRPLMKMGMKFSPLTIVIFVTVLYAFLAWGVIKSAWLSDRPY